MPDTAFVVFDKEKNTGRQSLLMKSGFLRLYLGMAIFHLLNKKRFTSGTRVFQFDAAVEILSIELPFPKSSLDRLNRKYLTGYISRICSENGCVRCFFPSAVNWTDSLEAYCTAKEIRPVVFKGLLIPVLNEIYIKAGIRMDSLDIAFVCGDDPQGLLTLVKQLEPFVKYINVASSGRESVERGLAEICADSGLSIFISGDFSSILKDADLIINLGKAGVLSRHRIRPRTLVINFGADVCPKTSGEFQIINGVEFTFPDEKFAGLGEGILRNYAKAELAEVLLALKARLFDGNECNAVVAVTAADVFRGSGCHITGFIGRRGVLQPEDMKKALGLHY